jgi:hypothetical protein
MSKLLTIGICVAIALTLLTGMRSGTLWPIWGSSKSDGVFSESMRISIKDLLDVPNGNIRLVLTQLSAPAA